MRRASFDEGVKAAAKSLAKVEDVTDVTPAASGTLQLEAEPDFQV